MLSIIAPPPVVELEVRPRFLGLSDEDPPDEDFVDEVDELVDEDDLVACCC
jgi:hypothetical protein